MTSDDRQDGRPQHATLSALTLLAAADFVTDFGYGRLSRRSHPPAQEADRSSRKAHRLSGEAGAFCERIRYFVALAQAPDNRVVSDVCMFELLRAVNACNSRLRLLHQSLMSLYPGVTAELVESVRLAAVDANILADLWCASSEVFDDVLEGISETLRSVRAAVSESGS